MTDYTTLQRVTRARAALILDHPFFGALALRLQVCEDASCQTAATDGRRIRFNPQFVATLSDAELRGVIAHEVMHCAAGHLWRKGDRDHERWNVAADMACNPLLRDAGLTLPEGALFDSSNPPRSAEEIYASLPPSQSSGNGSGQGAPGAGAPAPGSDPADGSSPDPGGCGGMDDPADDPADDQAGSDGLESDWRVAVVQAEKAARMMGQCPAAASRLVEQYTRPPLPWQTILADYVQRAARNDYDWARPSPRYFSRGIILPGLRSNELPDVVIVRDTSGSIDGPQFAAFSEAISDVLAAYPTTAHVLDVDAEVQAVNIYSSADLPIRPADGRGGGGTDFRPAFDWTQESGITPAILIYLTDLDGRFPDQAPDFPVLWVSTERGARAPWGDVVELTD